MELAIFLIIGTVGMLAVMFLERIDYRIPAWKTIIISVLLTLAGLAGAKLMRFIESGVLTGESYYGAVFFAPILMIVAALLFHVKISDVLDMCAPAECIMLALLKVNCLIQGCCGGKIFEAFGESFVFPSQLAEMLNGIVLMFVLLIMIRYEKNREKIYPWYMILYGVTRFILNFFRETEPFVFGIPSGHLWSIVSVIVGIVWIILISMRRKKRNVEGS